MYIDDLINILKNSDPGNNINILKITKKQYNELMVELMHVDYLVNILKDLKYFNGPFGAVELEIVDE